MSEETATRPSMDPALLAKLTGGLGDQATISRICASFGQVYAEFLPDIIKSEIDFDVTVGYVGCTSGLMGDLVADLDENFAIVRGSLRNWCQTFVLACGTGFVMTLMEHMLGALPETIAEPALRPLSAMELDLAVMVFDKIGNVLRSAVNAPGGFEPLLERPVNVEDRTKSATDQHEMFAASIRMTITLGATTSEFMLIIPQKVLLKTAVTVPKAKGQSAKSDDWIEQIGEQVRRSQVTLDARIKLQTLTLETISRLAVGDIIPFRDGTDVDVDVSANGRDLYVCEFGRSGEHYTVRVKDNVSSDDEILKHLMT